MQSEGEGEAVHHNNNAPTGTHLKMWQPRLIKSVHSEGGKEGEKGCSTGNRLLPRHSPEYVAAGGAHLGNVDDRDAHLEWRREGRSLAV